MKKLFTPKEVVWILIAIIIATFIAIFPAANNIPLVFAPAIAILINVIVKKISAEYYNIEIRYRIWEFQRYSYYERGKLKNPFPIGLFLPFLLSLLSTGIIKSYALLQFDYKNLPRRRMLKRSGNMLYRRTEINEGDPAFTALWGTYALILVGIIAILVDYKELAYFAITYNLWNLIPFGSLDGSRIFFGSMIGWILVVIANVLTLAFIIPILSLI